ncbi:MAG TPA: cupin-like domain-containing protein [Allosphingosinicella sp.]|nr:cupin-like domain-containing protein [Allosphingosinicella sp.]
MRPVADYRDVDPARFLEEIRPLGRPAVLRGLAAHWPAVAAGTGPVEGFADYLMRFADPREVPVLMGPPEIQGRFFYRDDLRALNFTRAKMRLGAFLGLLLAQRGEARPDALSLQSEPIPELLPGFHAANDIGLLDPSVVPRAWLGNAVRVAAHYDVKENIGVVVAGRRRFTLFPPEQVANLYPGPFELTPAGTPVSLVDPAAPDLARFPRFAAALAQAQVAELEPGDAIYIPYHWWHAVDSLEPVNLFVNYWWNPAMPGLGAPYDALLHAFLAFRHLPPEQREVWRLMFDHYIFCSDGDPAEHLPPDVRGVMGAPTPEQLRAMRAMLKQALGRL